MDCLFEQVKDAVKSLESVHDISIEDNAEWMETPDGSYTLAIGTMESLGVWITLRPDGTYAIEPITP